VGYQTLTASGQFYSSGPTFISVGDANGGWRLGDISAEGMEAGTDFIQFLSPSTAFTVVSATYIDAATAAALEDPTLQGWWDLGIENRLDDLVFSAGTGFLCNFSTVGVSLVYSGEVLVGETALDLSGQQFPMIANLTPVDLTLGDITASGMEAGTDFIQFLSPTTAFTEVSATYIDAATAAALEDPTLQGWWDLGIENRLDSQVLLAGASVLGNFTSSNVIITFPNPVE
jgi:aryl carrier-like protein